MTNLSEQEVQRLADELWNHLCPGIRKTEADEAWYRQAVRIVLAAVRPAQPTREEIIEECAALAQRWSDDAAEFKDSERRMIQVNVCRNLAMAIRNLAKTGGQEKPGETEECCICHHWHRRGRCTEPTCPYSLKERTG